MQIPSFTLGRLPDIRFGSGALSGLTDALLSFGPHVLLITGQHSFVQTAHWQRLQQEWQARGIVWHLLQIATEPSPDWVDQAVARCRETQIDVVVGIGGGSALDAAKAVAGLLPSGDSVMRYLEGVGSGAQYQGPATPLIAVPTTAGTGSEATRNAVLSQQGDGGFKKSFRDQALVPRIAIVDPDLLQGCSQSQLAANGMDAFTQLLESYVSLNASPITDALAWSGMQAFCSGFWQAWRGGPDAGQGFSQIAYASMLSGITLAQAGLGSVHGLASPLGAYFPIPHGVACGTLLADATAVNIHALQARSTASPALSRYADAGRLISGQPDLTPDEALETLVERLSDWTAQLDMPRLGQFGVTEADLPRILAGSRGGSMKTNPIELTDAELSRILLARL